MFNSLGVVCFGWLAYLRPYGYMLGLGYVVALYLLLCSIAYGLIKLVAFFMLKADTTWKKAEAVLTRLRFIHVAFGPYIILRLLGPVWGPVLGMAFLLWMVFGDQIAQYLFP